MSKSSEWTNHLMEIGMLNYYEQHQKLFDEYKAEQNIYNGGVRNELTAEAIIRAVALMIQENDTRS